MKNQEVTSCEPASILIVETRPGCARRHLPFIARCCEGVGGSLAIDGMDEAINLCERDRFDTIVLSIGADEADPGRLIRLLSARQSHAAIIVVTDAGSLNGAIELMRCGAADILVRPVSEAQLRASLARFAGPSAKCAAAAPAHSADGPAGMIGACTAMERMYVRLEQAAPSNATVFLHGESGTGKELCAEAVHQLSRRASGPMISINCSAIPRELMESEIFGHERGAFTGAHEMRRGAAEIADGGTLFLDEICEMDLALQAKLLRFIQTGQFMRVGGSKLQKVDVRFVCATNKDPQDAVEAGEFRADLFYRLHVLPIDLPPLRTRGKDILSIARDALHRFARDEGKQFATFELDAERMLLTYSWPGNVRQLLNTIRNIVVMNDGERVTSEMIPLPVGRLALGSHIDGGAVVPRGCGNRRILDRGEDMAEAVLKPLWQQEQDIIERAIMICDGNIGAAAAHLEISPSTIYRKRNTWTQAGAA